GHEAEALLQLLDQALCVVEQIRELAELRARHLDGDADRRARRRRERERLLAVARERGQVEVLVAPEPCAGCKGCVGGPHVRREHAGIVPRHVHGRLAALEADRGRPHSVAGRALLVPQHGDDDRACPADRIALLHDAQSTSYRYPSSARTSPASASTSAICSELSSLRQRPSDEPCTSANARRSGSGSEPSAAATRPASACGLSTSDS